MTTQTSQVGLDASSEMGIRKNNAEWILTVLLIIIFALGIYFRVLGIHWDDGTHLHPDERFLTMVETAISPVHSISEYFNTATSSLNPGNRGFTFFVYGDLPIFIIRYVGQAIGQIGYDQIDIVGRYISGLADMLTVLMVYLIARRLYRRRVAVLAAAFAAFSVLPIQLSHFFVVDTITNFFGFTAIYFAVRILTSTEPTKTRESTSLQGIKAFIWRWGPYALFGLALGMATASKVNAAVLAFLLPVAEIIRVAKIPREEWQKQIVPVVVNLAIAGAISLLAFRIFQPYAFTGPGFFGIKPNPQFINNMLELSSQTNGNVDFPPALQWAARPVTFSWTNMVEWGMGLPLGLLATAGFLWMGWRIIKGGWKQHFLLWIWTGAYFSWESLSFTKTMRYQMLVYPSLAIIAAWMVFDIWDWGKSTHLTFPCLRFNFIHKPVFWRIVAGILGSSVLLGTFAWAFAFTRIYTRPLTRVAASDWIYQNVPGPINLRIDQTNGTYNQPLGYHAGIVVNPSQPFNMAFLAQEDGGVTQVTIPFVVDNNVQTTSDNKTIQILLASASSPQKVLTSGYLTSSFPAEGDSRGQSFTMNFAYPGLIKTGGEYLLIVKETEGQGSIQIMGPIQLTIVNSGTQVYQSLPPPVQTITAEQGYNTIFSAFASGTLSEIYLPHIIDQSDSPGTKTLKVSISPVSSGTFPVSTGTVSSEFPVTSDGRGNDYSVKLQDPITVNSQSLYSLNIELLTGSGSLAVYGSAPALESSWDDALPQPVEGYNPYDYFSGIYQGDLNFEMYNDDNAAKLKLFETTLDEANYIFISSNRQWATTTRVPQRYPLTSAYYRNLLGCPDNDSIIWCYAVAEPGMFTGKLGYDLVAVFTSYPNLGPIQINDQFAEEAFTVYDHPKVLIFKKEASYSPQTVRNILRAVDLSNVIHVTPREAGSLPPPPKSLMLSSVQMAIQKAGGTWSQLFNVSSILNSNQVAGVIIWYLAVLILGLLVYPILRITFPGLFDRGYPLSKAGGLLLLSFLVWMGGSEGIPFTRTTITVAILLIALVGGFLAYWQRKELIEEWRSKKRYFLMIEGLALTFFMVDLLIRLGNPDLWHPYFGGEKPMDFAFLNAVIKSTTFPPYDPWFAGGYINYYYYGYVIVGVLVKWIGIVPSIAYNLILPTLFSIVATAAFCFGWNVTHAVPRLQIPPEKSVAGIDPDPGTDSDPDPDPGLAQVEILDGSTKTIVAEKKPANITKPSLEEEYNIKKPGIFDHAFWVGIFSALGLLILGNLGTVRMVWQGFQKLAAPGGNIDNVSIITHWIWSVKGFFVFLTGVPLPYSVADWYWIPSRAISTPGGNEITEFPFFTFLYADLHAHMIALGFTILALIWALSIILSRAHWGEKNGKGKTLSLVLSFFFGALIIGVLRPTNTWDYPTYLAIGVIALIYTLWKYYNPKPSESFLSLAPLVQKLVVIAVGVGALVGLSILLFEPFSQWYGQAYEAFVPWTGGHTPFWSYLTHWGLFLFVIVSWMAWETYDWMRNTPLRSLVKLRPYQLWIDLGAVILVAAIVYLTFIKAVQIAWLVLILAVWAGILILRPGQPDIKRAVLFITGTALTLTLFVELFVLVGDIGRMNTVFKFYYQAWTLLALSAAAGLGWMIQALPVWKSNWRTAWQTAAVLLVVGAALFPITATISKIQDRIAPNIPLTLDGMTYMEYSTYVDPGTGVTFQLNQDYLAIRWMQENVKGSPVIVEGNTPEYRWGSRFSIYTGLPGVVGWNWHERQQRASLPSTIVTDRIADIQTFYTTTDKQTTINFLHKYDVQYIIVGQLERAYYPGPGLDKFTEWNGVLWQQVYQDGETVIYKVLP